MAASWFDGGRPTWRRTVGRGVGVTRPGHTDESGAARRLKDRYSLGSVLGRGSLGVTYHAHDHILDRAVAVRVVSDRYADDAPSAERFLAAATAASQLMHPNVVAILDSGLVDGKPFVVMELVKGRGLRGHMAAHGALAVQECERIAVQLASAVAAAHRRGIVHGDIRPENVLLDEHGTAKLTDFGLARAAVAVDSTEVGSTRRAAQAPPTRPIREAADVQADLYGLGTVVYELLTEQTPSAAIAADGAQGRVRAAPPPVRRRRPDVTERLARAVSRAVSPYERDRFASAEELRRALVDDEHPTTPMAALAGVAPAPTIARGPELAAPPRVPTPPVVTAPVVAAPARRSESGRGRLRGGPDLGGLVGLIPLLATLVLVGAGALLVTGVLPKAFSGLEIVGVPRLLDYDLSEATSIAAAQGLGVRVINSIATDDRPRDSIVSQEPRPDSRVRRGNEVKLTISAGIRPPNVLGKPLDEARATLVRSGWTVGEVETREDAPGSVGTVVATRPGPEEPATSRQQPIALVVSGAKAVAAPAPSLPAPPPANLAIGRPVRLSNQQAYPGVIVDGNPGTLGVVNLPLPHWVEIDLAQPSTVVGAELVTYLDRPGDTAYEIWAWTADNKLHGLHTFAGPVQDNQTLSVRFDQAVPAVRTVRVVLKQGTRLTGWREIRILGQ